MSRTSAMLTGLSLATGVARDAADGVPIVKQVLGVASRVVTLAEQIDKNREDLYALAERARRMDATISAAVAERELDDEMLRRLEGLAGVLREVEKQFSNHLRRGRISRGMAYIFTVRKEVENLTGQLDDRLKELELAANLDTNIIARGNSRFTGEFRSIRHCEVHLLRPIATPRPWDGRYSINCHLATCEGSQHIFVVRNIVLSCQDDHVRRRVDANEKILEELSLIQNRHSTIAYLYGRNTGPKHNRFLVLNAGSIRPLRDILNDGALELSVACQIASRLVDAICHLERHGVTWIPSHIESADLYVDENKEPKIGIHNDLYTLICMPPDLLVLSCIRDILDLSSTPSHRWEGQNVHTTIRSDTFSPELYGELLRAGNRKLYRQIIFRRSDVTRWISQESLKYLRRQKIIHLKHLKLGDLLLGLASGMTWEGALFGLTYLAPDEHRNRTIQVVSIEDDGESIHYVETHFDLPPPAAEDVRRRLAIPALHMFGGPVTEFDLIHNLGASARNRWEWFPAIPIPSSDWGQPGRRERQRTEVM